MSKARVFVVQPIPEVALDIMRAVAAVEVYPYADRQVTVDELSEAVRRSDYVFTMHETLIPRRVFEANPDLKGIGCGGHDYADMIDVAACSEHGVELLFHDPADAEVARIGNAKATADLTVALLMCLAYRVIEADRHTKAGNFRQEMSLDLMGVGCTGQSVGIIGMGYVARALALRLNALEMDVRYTKRRRLSPQEEAELGITWVEKLDDLVADVDFVAMMANYHPDAVKLMGEKQFSLMKPTAYFVNTGRGRLVDEAALIRALEDGTIAGAGLDVFWNEPPVVHDPDVPIALRHLPNVVVAPHNGGATWDSRGWQASLVAQSIVDHINGVYVAPPEGSW
ncbi:MAG: glyoxylate reductase [Acidimicrobiaceae bacterium]|jgi:glyoxylate reductase|nr:glyoxylate reductase [Acidimicrobiaceae bacterium]